ncbi:MAG: OsmC family protein [Rhodothermia bacterium]|nr:MAG: OsmC family protein [Rhodothermia bacterium]
MATIKVQVKKQETDFHFRAQNERGLTVDIDDAEAYEDGAESGVGPMQLLLMALGGCSGFDIMSILMKSRQQVEKFDMEITGQKPDGTSPSVYSNIHVRFVFKGKIDASKARRAIELSLEKYCSVAATLGKSAEIGYDFMINGELLEGNTYALSQPE